MVKRAQMTFILITMSILLGVFSAIYFGLSSLIKIAHTEFAENSLDEAFQSIPFSEDFSPDKIIIIDGVIKSNNHGVLTDEQILSLYEQAKTYVSRGIFGSANIYRYTYYYKFYTPPNDANNSVFVAADMTDNVASIKKSNMNTLFLLLIIYAIIGVLVWSLSSKIFKPIKNTLEKQKQFISDASHELKTPLTIINANADVLAQNGENNQFIENIKSQTARMDVLVADMLSLAKLDEGRITLQNEAFDISEVVTECVLPFDALAFEKNKNLNMDIAPDVVYYGDRSSVKKIINILIDNAIKYSTKDIEVKLRREGGKIIALSVFNTGSNIPDKDSNMVFERFYSGENSHSRESAGSGLGLSIAKGIADANKWKIEAESVYGKSMTITVYMKIKSAN